MPKRTVESLAKYLARIIKEKNLRQREVQENSGGQITDGYVRSIMAGKTDNPSVRKLQALARGLSVDEEEIFRVARGQAVDGNSKSGRKLRS